MIQDFVFVLNNGIRKGVHEFLPSVPLLQQINDPEYHPRAYEWESDGQIYTRLIDGCDTLTARLLPDGSGVAVLQAEDVYGPDNVVIVEPTNEVRQRIINPYRDSRFFMPGDKFSFYGITSEPTEFVLDIQAQRKLAKCAGDAMPIYEATYDPESLKLLKLEWKPWT